MAKETLHSLSVRNPDPAEVESMLLGLQTQDDRTAAIVGASLVESALEHLLVATVQSNAETLKQRLFENRGPLSDFNSKILIAQAFGLIAERVAEDMQRIRRIRNCFAHARLPVTFEEPLVAKEVSALAAVMAVRSTEAHYVYEPFPYHSHKTSYGLSCYITTLLLNHRHVEKGGDAFIRM